MAGLAASIAKTIVRLVGAKRAILAIVLMGAVLTYSGVSLFVVVFAVYPFAKNMFQEANIPKRLIPGTIALGLLRLRWTHFRERRKSKMSSRRRFSKQTFMPPLGWA